MEKIKVQIYDGPHAMLLFCCMLLTGAGLLILSSYPFLLLRLPGWQQTNGTAVEGSYTMSLHGDGNTNRYVTYVYEVDGREYRDRGAAQKNYHAGSVIHLVYSIEHPEKNRMLRIEKLPVFLGLVILWFSVEGIRQTRKIQKTIK